MTVFLSTDRLHLLLALVSALTGTWWGIATAVLVLAVLLARRSARRSIAAWPSPPTGRRVLSPAQHTDPLHPPRRGGQHAARV